ncbi:MAG TPA: nucleotide exchange factor GrpE [Actinomycetota bacterium]|nr:nucleotide exchange factor GrpE [Actinomycetota bacterium]
MTDPTNEPRKVPVRDLRGVKRSSEAPTEPSPSEANADPTEEKHDYLGDLQRLQAEFENYRKRMMRDQAGIAERAAGRLMERLLPVLDNFERAIAHGEGGEGVALVFRELKETLAKEGLEEVSADGLEFDPQVHDAIAAHEDPDVEQPLVKEVSRRGYSYKGQLLRPAMVVVATPASAAGEDEDAVQEEKLTETHEDV